jgi:hypothetical protein
MVTVDPISSYHPRCSFSERKASGIPERLEREICPPLEVSAIVFQLTEQHKIKGGLLDVLGLPPMPCWYVSSLQRDLSRLVVQAQKTAIAVNARAVVGWATARGTTLTVAVGLILAHQYGHAFLENYPSTYGNDEFCVERAAHHYLRTGNAIGTRALLEAG